MDDDSDDDDNKTDGTADQIYDARTLFQQNSSLSLIPAETVEVHLPNCGKITNAIDIPKWAEKRHVLYMGLYRDPL